MVIGDAPGHDPESGTGGGVFPASDKTAVVLQMLKALTTVRAG